MASLWRAFDLNVRFWGVSKGVRMFLRVLWVRGWKWFERKRPSFRI